MKKEKGVQKGVMEGGERNVEEGFERRRAGARKKRTKGGSEEGRTHGKANALTARVMGFLVGTRWLNLQVFWCTMIAQDKAAAKTRVCVPVAPTPSTCAR